MLNAPWAARTALCWPAESGLPPTVAPRADTTRAMRRAGTVMSVSKWNVPSRAVRRCTRYPSTETRAPATGFPFQSTRPCTFATFDESACQGRTTRPRCAAILAVPRGAASGAFAALPLELVFGAWTADSRRDDPGSAKTWSCATVPPFEEVGVPPTVIATYSLPSTEEIDGPAGIGFPVWNVHRILPVFRLNARTTPSPPPAKPSPLSVVVMPPRSGSGVWNFHTLRPVETSIALIDP